MGYVRLIARMDIKGPNLIKGVHLEGLRKVGDPQKYALQYYEDGIDELIYMDIVASLYGRNNLQDIVSYTAKNIFVPLTVGGGIRSVQDARELLRAGADKVAINTAATNTPELITDIAHEFGSQCVTLSIEAKRTATNRWEAYTDNGREHTYMDAIEWAKKGVELGAGEILITSVDQEGTKKGFDLELTKAVNDVVNVPVIASGGMGSLSHLSDLINTVKPSGVAMADILHYKRSNIKEIRSYCIENEIPVRKV